jgi:hypothetical protein
MKRLILCLALVLPLCGCATIAEKLADAIEPQLERLVDAQIEREERMAGIWGTTNSYFHVQAEAARAAQEEEKQDLLAAVAELIAKNQDQLLAEAEKLVEKKIGGK